MDIDSDHSPSTASDTSCDPTGRHDRSPTPDRVRAADDKRCGRCQHDKGRAYPHAIPGLRGDYLKSIVLTIQQRVAAAE